MSVVAVTYNLNDCIAGVVLLRRAFRLSLHIGIDYRRWQCSISSDRHSLVTWCQVPAIGSRHVTHVM